MVQGVAHNLGFGKSIIHNESFAAGDYSTAFIPDFYPDGYSGDVLNADQKRIVALAAHQIKNIFLGYNKGEKVNENVVYVTVVGSTADEPDHDWRVEKTGDSCFKITDMATDETSEVDLSSFVYEHNSLIKMQGSSGSQTF